MLTTHSTSTLTQTTTTTTATGVAEAQDTTSELGMFFNILISFTNI